MGKIKLKTGQEYQIESIGQQSEDKLSFVVIGVTNYKDFRATLSKIALVEISSYTGETLIGAYEKFTSILPFTIVEQEDGTMNVTVNLKKENEMEARLSSVEDAIDMMIMEGLGVL